MFLKANAQCFASAEAGVPSQQKRSCRGFASSMRRMRERCMTNAGSAHTTTASVSSVSLCRPMKGRKLWRRSETTTKIVMRIKIPNSQPLFKFTRTNKTERNLNSFYRLHWNKHSSLLASSSLAVDPNVIAPFLLNQHFPLSLSGSVWLSVMFNALFFLLGSPVLLSGMRFSAIYPHAFVLGITVLLSFGMSGYLVMITYFIFGTLVTKLGSKRKKREGTMEENEGRRSWRSVWGSGVAAMICALIKISIYTIIDGENIIMKRSEHISMLRQNEQCISQLQMFMLCCDAGFLSSMASKLGDTVSSEVGKAIGKTTVLITTLERVKRGTEGAVSLEGTAAGIVGVACMVAFGKTLGVVRHCQRNNAH